MDGQPSAVLTFNTEGVSVQSTTGVTERRNRLNRLTMLTIKESAASRPLSSWRVFETLAPWSGGSLRVSGD